jgi:hypothetical protein
MGFGYLEVWNKMLNLQQKKLFDDSRNSNEKEIQVYFDGLCQPVNPGGTACFAFIVKKDDNIIHSEYGLAAHNSTNNVAEYTGIIKALEWLITNNYQTKALSLREIHS